VDGKAMPERKGVFLMGKPKVVSLFSGCGGMDLGFKNAGYELVWANDFEKAACDTYAINLGKHIVYGDITELDLKQIPDCDVIDWWISMSRFFNDLEAWRIRYRPRKPL